jgi:magnesium transporter
VAREARAAAPEEGAERSLDERFHGKPFSTSPYDRPESTGWRLSRALEKRSQKAGIPPGTIVYLGEPRSERVGISVIDYTKDQFHELTLRRAEECFPYLDPSTVTWINVDGIHDTALVERLGTHFGVHPLVLEDIVATDQRPKRDDYGEYLFVVARMLYFLQGSDELVNEQISLIIGKGFVISFQQRPGDVFDELRERLRRSGGRVRELGADYLAYCLLDAIVDNYFGVLERLGEQIESIEEELVEHPGPGNFRELHRMKRTMLGMRRAVWPMREVVNGLVLTESKLIKAATRHYLRDLYDHVIQAADTIETMREMLSGMLDIYLSGISNRTNDVIKFLTVVSVLFVPMTFIASFYGMNVAYLPMARHEWGFEAVFAVMVLTSGTMFVLLRRRRLV